MPTPAFLPVVVVVPTPTEVPVKNDPSFKLPPSAVMIPVVIVPEPVVSNFLLPAKYASTCPSGTSFNWS